MTIWHNIKIIIHHIINLVLDWFILELVLKVANPRLDDNKLSEYIQEDSPHIQIQETKRTGNKKGELQQLL